MRHQYNPEAETFVLDMTEELKEMVDKGTGFISIEVTKEASLDSDLGGKKDAIEISDLGMGDIYDRYKS